MKAPKSAQSKKRGNRKSKAWRVREQFPSKQHVDDVELSYAGKSLEASKVAIELFWHFGG